MLDDFGFGFENPLRAPAALRLFFDAAVAMCTFPLSKCLEKAIDVVSICQIDSLSWACLSSLSVITAPQTPRFRLRGS